MTMFQNAVGEQIYAWTRAKGQPSPGTTECVITAHGGQSIINSTFDVKGCEIVFYCPHGYSLTDPGLDPLLEGSVVSVEALGSGRCQDYVLSKFQGRHSEANETYRKIGNADTRIDEQIASVKERIDGLNVAVVRPTTNQKLLPALLEILDAKMDQLAKLNRKLDIISLRHRRLKPDMMLSEVIAALGAAKYGYTRFHCSFCRSPQLNVMANKGDFAPTRIEPRK